MVEAIPRDNKNTAKSLSRWYAIPPLVAGLLVAIVIGQFENTSIAKASGNSTVALVLFASVFWRYRHERWFWPYIGVASIIHVILIATVPWPGRPAAGQKDLFILFLFADVAGTALLGYFTAKLTGAPSTQPSTPRD